MHAPVHQTGLRDRLLRCNNRQFFFLLSKHFPQTHCLRLKGLPKDTIRGLISSAQFRIKPSPYKSKTQKIPLSNNAQLQGAIFSILDFFSGKNYKDIQCESKLITSFLFVTSINYTVMPVEAVQRLIPTIHYYYILKKKIPSLTLVISLSSEAECEMAPVKLFISPRWTMSRVCCTTERATVRNILIALSIISAYFHSHKCHLLSPQAQCLAVDPNNQL